jgi:hypothetical protein
MRRVNPTADVTARLWGRAAGRCEFPGCSQDLTRDPLTRRGGNFADRAHIRAIQARGPRGQRSSSAQAANGIENLMLLCQKHHRLIDREPAEFPIERLVALKAEHEARVARATNFAISSPSHVLHVRAAIAGTRVGAVTREDIWQVLTAGGFFPASDEPLMVEMADLGHVDGDVRFWESCEASLTRKLEAALGTYGALHRVPHLSVFALAPMPVLMVLGKILGDTRAATIHQFDRFSGSWRWLDPLCSEVRPFEYSVSGANGARRVALTIELSAVIDPELVKASMGVDEFATVRFSTPQPTYSLIRNPRDLSAFHEAIRRCLNEIEARFSSECAVHVFPAMPASTAVQFGRLLLPKSSPNIRIYDHQGGRAGFVPTLWLVRRTARRPRMPRLKHESRRAPFRDSAN